MFVEPYSITIVICLDIFSNIFEEFIELTIAYVLSRECWLISFVQLMS